MASEFHPLSADETAKLTSQVRSCDDWSNVQVAEGFDTDSLRGDEKTKDAGFKAVRGIFEENSFVSQIEEDIITKTELAEELISRLGKLR